MAAENVLQVLNKLNQCFAAGSRPLPAQKNYVPLVPVISFSLLGHDWAVPLDQVAELIEIQECTSLPGVKPWVVGVSTVRGKLLPVIDFAQFLGGQLSTVQRLRRIVVLDRQDTFVGLIIDELKGMRHFSPEACETDIQALESAFRPYVSGYHRGDDGVRTLLLSPDALIENPLFQNVALS